MNSPLRMCLLIGCVLAGWASPGQAGVNYLPERKLLWITGYPAGRPCDMETVMAENQRNQWGIVSHDETTDTYTIRADMWIGANDGTDTYFQLGHTNHPRENIAIHGDVLVYPAWVDGENQESAKNAHVNRLTVGLTNNADVTPAIRIASSKDDGHSFYVGVLPAGKNIKTVYSGQFHMHYGLLTALTEDKEHALGGPQGWNNVYLAGDSIHLFHSRIAWVKGCMTANMVMHLDTLVEDMVFEYGGVGVSDWKETAKNNLIRDCTFRHLDVALNNPHCLVVMSGCRFENNKQNWRIFDVQYDVTLQDCQWMPPEKADELGLSDSARKEGWQPRIVSKRHIVVEVKNAGGNPVDQAVVSLTDSGSGQIVAAAVTDKDGSTGRRNDKRGIMLTECVMKSAGSNSVAVQQFVYSALVKAAGYQPAVLTNICPTQSWMTVSATLVP